MAVQWMQSVGFLKDTGNPSDYDQFARLGWSCTRTDAEGPVLYPTDGPFGGPSFDAGRNNGDYLYVPLGTTIGPEFYFSAWFKRTTAPGSNQHICDFVSDDGVRHLALYLTSTYQLRVNRNTTALETSTETITENRWYHIEFYGEISNTTGDWNVKVNNTSWLQGTGSDDTLEGTGNANVARLTFNGLESHGARWAQPMMWSTSGDAPTGSVGPHKMWVIRPNGDGATTDFTPQGAGANYVEVDEAEADDDTTYNESGTSTNKDRLDCEALSETPTTIYAVKAMVLAKQTAPGALTIKPGIYSSTTESKPASGIGVGIDYDYFEHITTLNPADSAAWEKADVDAAQVQYEVV